MALTFAFVMDPLPQINTSTDTTFAFMLEAQKRGHRVIYVPPLGLDLNHNELILRGEEVKIFDRKDFYQHVRSVTINANECTAIFLRTDPPFDEAYLMVTWLLSFAERQGVKVINSPEGVRKANEKLYALEFAEHCPKTVVSASPKVLREFVESQKEAIAKPLDGHGGFGVVRLTAKDSNFKALLDLLTLEGKKSALVQAYLPEGQQGDKRLLVLNGQLRGAVKRVPLKDDHRGNVHVGGQVELCDIDATDQKIVTALAPTLKRDGLFFVGLDVIAGKLIEVNVTSPTLVQELKRLSGVDIAAELFESF